VAGPTARVDFNVQVRSDFEEGPMDRNTKRRRREALTHATIETLESRRLLSGATFADGLLTVTGPQTDAATIAVNFSGGVDNNGAARLFGAYVTINGTPYVFSNVAMTAVSVTTGDGNDTVTITGGEEDADAEPPMAISVSTGAGNDSVNGTCLACPLGSRDSTS
jgi:hypothetical protein